MQDANTYEKELELFKASKDNNITKVENLVKQNIDINYQNKDGQTALFIAVIKNNYNIVSVLIDYGADINIKDYTGYTIFWYGYKYNSIESLNIISHKKNSSNKKDSLDEFIKNFYKEPIDEIN